MRKLFVIGVIGLFFGLAVAPSINADVSKDDELVEFTTEICGLGGRKHTVLLTKEEAEEIDRLFISIRDRLNATDSKEEAEVIFSEAVVELDTFVEDITEGKSVQGLVEEFVRPNLTNPGVEIVYRRVAGIRYGRKIGRRLHRETVALIEKGYQVLQ